MTEHQMGCDVHRRELCATETQEALRCLEGRWKMIILSHLFSETVLRFSDLQRAIPGVSQKMLVQQLRDLEQHGVVKRTVYPQVPPRVEYSLTELGKGLHPVFVALLDWAHLRNAAAETAEAAVT